MKTKITATIVFLMISTVGYFAFVSDGTIREVEMMCLVGIGMAAGVLLTQVITHFREAKR